MITSEDSADRFARRGLDRIATAAAEILEVPFTVISVLDRTRHQLVGAHGLAAQGLQGDPCALCRDVAITRKPIVVQDTKRRSSTARNGWGRELGAYAGVPLWIEGARIGALAAFVPVARAWQGHDLVVLRGFADAAGAILDMQLRYTKATPLEVDGAAEIAEREHMPSLDHRHITRTQ